MCVLIDLEFNHFFVGWSWDQSFVVDWTWDWPCSSSLKGLSASLKPLSDDKNGQSQVQSAKNDWSQDQSKEKWLNSRSIKKQSDWTWNYLKTSEPIESICILIVSEFLNLFSSHFQW